MAEYKIPTVTFYAFMLTRRDESDTVLSLQSQWTVNRQWSGCGFAHFLIPHTLDTSLHTYSILFHRPISFFAAEKPIL